MTRQTRRRTVRRLGTTAVAGLLVVGLVTPARGVPTLAPSATRAADSASAESARPPAPTQVRPVPVRSFTPAPAKRDPEAPPGHRIALTDWPTAATGESVLAPPARGAESTRAGTLPVSVAPVAKAAGPARVGVRLGTAGGGALPFTLRRTDGSTAAGRVRVSVDYSGFADAYGGDWAARLRIAPRAGQPGGVTTSGDPAVATGVTAVRNDLSRRTVSAEVPVTATASEYVLSAPPEGSTGDYKATSLAPSGTWQVSTQGGDFSWQYPLRLPPTPGSLAPDLSLTYSSSAVDGRTVSTNNQASWVGEGWNLWPGYIERSYKACADDLGGNNADRKTGDLCWETENASMSFGQHAGGLVFSGGVWRPEADDGTRVEHLFRSGPEINGDDNGEYWRVTTTDGTQYYFGLNRLPGWSDGKPTTQSAWTVPVYGNDSGEPCHKSTYAESACVQAYRWNLDYVVDPHGNSISYHYLAENNRYGQNRGATTALYTRGGVLSRVDYGTRDGNQYATPAPAQVVFTPANRCVTGTNCATHDAVSWPDVPWDTDCLNTSCADKHSPTFWSTNRLAAITTRISTGASNYTPVDHWTLGHTYPPPGDGTTATLWLNSITRTGQVGTATELPPVTFDGTMKPNRVNSAPDGLPALNKMRITTITTESGGDVNVAYRAPDCSPGALPKPDTNTTRCFPVRWAMPPAPEPSDDWFVKHVVAQVAEHDRVTDARTVVTNYDYPAAGGAWAYDANPLVPVKRQTWSQWRGFEQLVVRKGDPAQDNTVESRTAYRYFRGMHGDRTGAGGTKTVDVTDSTGKALADSAPLAGFLREEVQYNGAAELQGAIHDPWVRPTGSQYNLRSDQVESVRTVARKRWSTGVRTTQVDTSYDVYGNAVKVNDLADVNTPADDRCTTRSYVHNTTSMLVSLPGRETVVGVACGTTPTFPADAISDTQVSYDGQAAGSAPTKGDVTRRETVKAYTGGTPQFLTTNTSTYDDRGRVLESRDALGRPTTTAYDETNGLTTAQRVTNALGHQSSTELAPAWGLALRQTDPNQRITSLRYDGLGRLVKVWQPGRSEADGDSPHLQYSYGLRRSGGPNWVRTQALKPNGNQVTSYTLLDGFLRERQRQSPSPQGGRILTDTQYNSRGLPVVHRPGLYDATGVPGTELKTVTDGGAVPNATVTVYDGAERKTDEIYLEKNVERWRTKTVHGGTNISVIPPPGGTVTTVWSDARDRVVARVQWHGRELTGPNDVTRYGYTKRGDLAKVTDAAGNVWRYEYDVLGRPVRADDPDKGVSTMSYDDSGQLRSVTDARNKTVATRYDVLGRPTETRLGSDTGTLLTLKVYDTLAKGAPTSSTRYSGGAEYTRSVTGYDEAGRPTGELLSIPAKEGKLAGEYLTSHTYAADSSPLATTLPALRAGEPGGLAKETLSFGYDSLGLADSVTGAQTYVTDTEHTALGEVAQVEFGAPGKNLWRSAYYQDGTRRLSEVLTTSLAPDGAFVHDFGYRYDPAGNVTRIADRTAGSAPDVQCFRHDYLRRTSAAWTAADPAADCASDPAASDVGGPAPYWQQFGYDLIGNRTSRTVKGLTGGADVTSTYGYPAAGDGVDRPHAVTSVRTGATTASYDYDQAGNLLHRPAPGGGTQTLSWDDQGLLASISSAAGETSYVYDADGTQLIRRDQGSATLFAGNGELTVDTATQVVRATRYYDGIGVRTASGLVWTEADHHGTAQVAIDSTTLKPTARRLDLFGNPRGGAVAWPAGDRGFVGGTTNDGTGLTRLGAREYDPELGRFISVDPVIDPNDPQQMNAYAYSNNNPASMADPDGLFYFVDLDGRVTAPPAAGQTKRVIQRVSQKLKRLAHNYDRKPKWPKYYKDLVTNPKAAPNSPWGAAHALLWPLISPGPEGDPARKRLQEQSAADADQAAKRHAQRMAEQDDSGGGGLLDWIGPSDNLVSAGMSARSAVISFTQTPLGRWLVHAGVSVGIGIGAGLAASAVCAFTAFVGCAFAVGAALGVAASGPAHIGAAHLMGEQYTSGDVIWWSLTGAFGGALNGGVRGVLGSSPIALAWAGARSSPGSLASVPLAAAERYLLNPSLWFIK